MMHKFEPGFTPPGSFSRNDKLLLFLVTLIGAIIRIAYLYDRSYTGDEIGTLIYIEKDVPFLLSHFTTWLTMNYFIVLEKVIAYFFGKGPLALGFVPVVAGIGTIPLTALLAVRFTSTRVALTVAVLISMNPYLIEYSGIIRSYSLLAALSILVMILSFKWRDNPSYSYGLAVALGSFILNLAHPYGVYTVVYIGFMIAVWFFKAPDKSKYSKTLATLLVPLGISCICIVFAYFKIFPEMLRDGVKWHDIPPTSISYVPFAFSQYFSGGFYGWLTAVFFITGVLFCYKYEKPAVVLLPALFLPILLISMQGLSHFPWGYARFLIFTVPIIIIIIAEGGNFFVTTYFSSRTVIANIVLVAFLLLSWVPRLVYIFEEKNNYPWNKVASFIKQYRGDRDIIVGSDWGEPFHLRPYYPEREDRILTLGESLLLKDGISVNTVGKTFFIANSYTIPKLSLPTRPSAHFVKTTQPTHFFGNIQVIVYTPSPEHPVLQKIRQDLIDTVKVGEEVGPEFTPIYKNILDINNALGLDDQKLCYYNLWMKCSQLTPRQIYMPSQLRIGQARQNLKECR